MSGFDDLAGEIAGAGDRPPQPIRYGTVISRDKVNGTVVVRPSNATATDGSQDFTAVVQSGHLPVVGAIVRFEVFQGDVIVVGTKLLRDFLNEPKRVGLYAGSAQTFTTGTTAVMAWDSEDYDDWSMHNGNGSKITVPDDGTWEISVQVFWAANITGYRTINVRKNASASPTGGTNLGTSRGSVPGSSIASSVAFERKVVLAAGDEIEVFCTQNSGGNLDTVSGAPNTFFQMTKIASS